MSSAWSRSASCRRSASVLTQPARSNDRAPARPIPDAQNGVPRVSMPEGTTGDPGQLPLFAAASPSARRSGQVSPDVLLSEIAQLLLSEESADRVFDAVADALSQLVPYDTLSLYQADNPLRVLRPVLVRDAFVEQILAMGPIP